MYPFYGGPIVWGSNCVGVKVCVGPNCVFVSSVCVSSLWGSNCVGVQLCGFQVCGGLKCVCGPSVCVSVVCVCATCVLAKYVCHPSDMRVSKNLEFPPILLISAIES